MSAVRSASLWIACCALASCRGEPRSEIANEPVAAATSSSQPDAGRALQWAPVQAAENAPVFEVVGQLLPPPNARAELTLPLPATVLRVLVDHGQRVERGAALVEVAMPEAARASARLQGARLRMDAYRSRLTHLETLRGEGLARGGDLADARARLAEATADEFEALAVQQMVEAAGLRRQGNRYVVVAPVAGVVVEVDAPLGSMRGPGDGAVVSIAGGAPTRIEARFAFPLPEAARYEWVEAPADTRNLRLVSEAPQIMPEDATRLVWFDTSKPIDMPHGAIVHVRVVPPPGTWLVPSAAVQREQESRFVVTRRTGRVKVEVLAKLGNDLLVRGALQAGDVVGEQHSS